MHAVRPGAACRVVVGDEVRGGRGRAVKLREAEHVGQQLQQRAGALPRAVERCALLDRAWVVTAAKTGDLGAQADDDPSAPRHALSSQGPPLS